MSDKIEDIEIFPWNTNFVTGIEEIDEQHKKLIILLNKLANTLTQDEICKIEDVFAELAQYANYHFECEEKIWESYFTETHPLMVSHKSSHHSFLPKIKELQEKNKDLPFHNMVEEILLFLIRWLAFHIIDEDKRLALIIKSINKGMNLEEITDVDYKQLNSSSLKILLDSILSMYDNLSLKTIKLIKEKKARIKAQNELKLMNKKLEKLSITDQLTELFNRRHFEEVFEQELKKAKRNNTILSIIMFDIDFFKNLNDTYGHIQGDKALRDVAKCVKKVCRRPNDFAFRVGGEEFVILISNEDHNNPLELCELLRKEIEKEQIPNENSSISNYLTISAGIVSKIPESSDNIDSFIKIVDEKLYQAKELGRNLIIF